MFATPQENQPLVVLAFKTLDLVKVDNMAAVNPQKYLWVQLFLNPAKRVVAKQTFALRGKHRCVVTVRGHTGNIRKINEIGFLIFLNRQFVQVNLGFNMLGVDQIFVRGTGIRVVGNRVTGSRPLAIELG